MIETFKSKVDTWIGAMVLVPPIAAMVTISTAHDHAQTMIGWSVLAMYGAILFGLAVPLRYVVSADELLVQSGRMRIRIPWTDVRSMEPSRDPRSSPALSLDRLAVHYVNARGEHARVLISPERRADFLARCAAASGGLLVVNGEALTKS
jgi:hypothetical protein